MNIKEKKLKPLFSIYILHFKLSKFCFLGEPLEANKAHVIQIHIISRLGVLIIYDMLKIQTDRRAKRGDNKLNLLFFQKL